MLGNIDLIDALATVGGVLGVFVMALAIRNWGRRSDLEERKRIERTVYWVRRLEQVGADRTIDEFYREELLPEDCEEIANLLRPLTR